MKKFLIVLSLCLFCLFASGCIKLGGKVAPQKTYLLSLPKQKSAQKRLTKACLEISATTAASPFDMNQFIYRISTGQFISDYYHMFLSSPNDQVTDLTLRYFAAKPLFTDVMSASNQTANPDYILQARIIDLYADYKNSRKPQAVMAIRFQLFKMPMSTLKFSKLFTARVPLKAKTNEALVLAWNKCILQILQSVYKQVYKIVLD